MISNKSNKYYYPGNRRHARFPWEDRKLSEDVNLMEEIECECRPSVRQNMAKSSGYTGLSSFYELFLLYGFDYLLDFLFDVMHNVPMNVGKRHLDWLVKNNLVDPEEIERRLKDWEWSSGRVLIFFG